MSAAVCVGIGFLTLIFLLAQGMRHIHDDSSTFDVVFVWLAGSVCGAAAVALITWAVSS